ncbi:MAG: hypothetical protein QGF20_18155 [Alphaproteobacteria bacterium]|nr:hypothetical protein [Alphaproteobacteria bacterium]
MVAGVLLAIAAITIAKPISAQTAEVYELVVGDKFEIVFSSGPMKFKYVGVENGLHKFAATWKGKRLQPWTA